MGWDCPSSQTQHTVPKLTVLEAVDGLGLPKFKTFCAELTYSHESSDCCTVLLDDVFDFFVPNDWQHTHLASVDAFRLLDRICKIA